MSTKQLPKLDDRFITNIKGKDFVLYAGVLDLATQKGLLRLEVELLQFPTKENGNECIVRAIAETKTGEVFSDIADANPKNCHKLVVKHLIRMASTRAKARCLRDMCNISIAAVEELADFDDVLGSEANGNNNRGGTNSNNRNGRQAYGRGRNRGKQTAKGKIGKGKQPQPNATAKRTKAAKSDSKGTKISPAPVSEAQKRALRNLIRRKGVAESEIKNWTGGGVIEDLSAEEASSVIRNLQKST